jgi:hypothetical protein
MSTAGLPNYAHLDISRTPSYTAEPRGQERRVAHALGRARPSSDFVKQSRSGGVSLRLTEQVDGIITPVYGLRNVVDGVVELAKPEGIAYIAVKVSGALTITELSLNTRETSYHCRLKGCSASKRLQREVRSPRCSAMRPSLFGAKAWTQTLALRVTRSVSSCQVRSQMKRDHTYVGILCTYIGC